MGAGLELPDLRIAPALNLAVALWREVLSASAPSSGRVLVVTNETGKVVFVSAI